MQKPHSLIILIFMLTLTACNSAYPTDMTFKKGVPQSLNCQAADMPGMYLMVEDLSGARPNKSLTINVNDPKESGRYIKSTGRVEGWENRFMLTEPTETLPGFVLCQVVLFKSPQGAQEALFWNNPNGMEVIQTDRQIGDEMLFTQAAFNAPDGSPWTDIRIEFTFHNLLGAVSTYVPENVADADYALDLAELMHQRMLENTP